VSAARRDATIAAGLFAGLLVAYHANGGFLPGHDAVPNVHLAVHLVRYGRAAFTPDDAPFMFVWMSSEGGRLLGRRFAPSVPNTPAERERRDLLARGLLRVHAPDYYIVPSVDPPSRGWVGIYGPGTGLVALPAVALFSRIVGDPYASPAALWNTMKAVAAVCVAASAALVFVALRGFLAPREAGTVALAYGLGTCVWSVSSQALWQSTPVLLFTALAACLVLRVKSTEGAALAGLAAAWAVVCRPTAVVTLAAIGVSLLGHRRRAAAFAFAALPPLAFLAWWNAYYLGSPLTFGQQIAGRALAQAELGLDDPWGGSLVAGLLGQLVSPSRGLLVYSPILLVGFAGAVAAWRNPRWRSLRPFGVAAVLVLLAQSGWFDWHGGYSFGYRLAVDVAPLLALASAPVVPTLRTRPVLLALVGMALAWSVGAQVIGAWAFDIIGWNARIAWVAERPGASPVRFLERETASRAAGPDGTVRPVAMDFGRAEFRYRLWSIGDSPLVYYATHFAESRRRRTRIIANWPVRYQVSER
jgi:hypothetical protein